MAAMTLAADNNHIRHPHSHRRERALSSACWLEWGIIWNMHRNIPSNLVLIHASFPTKAEGAWESCASCDE